MEANIFFARLFCRFWSELSIKSGRLILSQFRQNLCLRLLLTDPRLSYLYSGTSKLTEIGKQLGAGYSDKTDTDVISTSLEKTM